MPRFSVSRMTIAVVAVAAIALGSVIVLKARGSNDACADACCAPKTASISASLGKPLVCKLSSPEVLARKATVIAELKREMIDRKELPNGYSFRFKGDEASIDRLVSFVKSERQCCGFFNFNISVTEDYASLELTGPEGAKDFVTDEIGL